jgi:hypothetical protein
VRQLLRLWSMTCNRHVLSQAWMCYFPGNAYSNEILACIFSMYVLCYYCMFRWPSCSFAAEQMKGYKPEVTNPQNCKKLVFHFIQLSKQRFILCQTWLTVTLTVQCCNLVNFSGTKIKGYFIVNFTLKYLHFSMLWVSHLWLVTLQIYCFKCGLWSSGLWGRVVLQVVTNVSGEHFASNFREK